MLALLVFGPMAGAVVSFICGKYNKTARDVVAGVVATLEVVLLAVLGVSVLSGGEVVCLLPGICQMGMNFKLDGFRLLYGMVAAFMWMMTTIFSPEYFAHYRNRNRYYFFVLMTLGATVGVFLSADLFTTFINFEIMSFTSYVWVAQEEKPEALRAAETYLAVAVIGGMVMLMGIFMLYFKVGTLEIDKLYEACAACPDKAVLYAAGACMLFGFGAKAGMFPLHIWLPKAHPVAPAPSSALLSGILTKSGIYGVLAVSCNIFRHDKAWGTLILALGVVTMFLGAFIALFSINLKRTLACSSMSQIGFILVGVGMQGLLGEENALAVRGTVLHMVNHSMIKLILFMCAGVIYFNIHKLELNDIRGFGRGKKLLTACFAVGGLSISGFPLFSGYVSKTLLHESIVEFAEEIAEVASMADAHTLIKTAEWIFLLTGGMTFAYMLKLFICVFVEKNSDAAIQASFDERGKKYMKPLSAFAITLPSVILFVMGILPYATMNKMAHLALEFMAGEEPHEFVNYFSLGNLKGGAISLTIGLVLYFGFIRTVLIKKSYVNPDEGVTRSYVNSDADSNSILNEQRSGAGEKSLSYVNLWPEWLDLENLIYRPLIQHIIPFIGAFVLRCFDKVTDGVIALTQKTILSEAKPRKAIAYGNTFTYVFGTIMNVVSAFLNVTVRRNKPVKVNYIERLAVAYNAATRTMRIAALSVSYGLLLFAAGLIITLVYLITIMERFL